MPRTIGVEVKGLERLREKVGSDKLLKRELRKGLRQAANAVKRRIQARGRPISRKLAKRVTVTIARDLMGATIRPTAAWANTAERGRRPGAKQPPAGVLTGGWAAARVVARRGLPARPFVAPAATDARADVQRILQDTAVTIEAAWRG